jgi:hypothetical protein
MLQYVKIQRNTMKTKLLLKKTLIMTVAIVSMCASQNLSAMTTTLRTAGTASKNLYKATPKRAYHDILGVGSNATKAEVDTEYLQLAKKYHPDVNKNSDAAEKIIKINQAHQLAKETKYASAEVIQKNNLAKIAKEKAIAERQAAWEIEQAKFKVQEAANKAAWEQKQAAILAQEQARKAVEQEALTKMHADLAAQAQQAEQTAYNKYLKRIFAGLTTSTAFAYGAYQVTKPKSEDNTDNGHIKPISQAPIMPELIIQDNPQARSMWAKMAENSTEFVMQNPAITLISAAAIISTAAYYAYKYITAPKKEEAADQENTEVTKDKEADNKITALDDTEEPS